VVEKLKKVDVSKVLGKITIYVFFASFFVWTGGIKYSVWLGVLALLIKKFANKEELVIGPKILAYSNLYIFVGTVLIDIITYSKTGRMGAFDRYNIFLMYFVLLNYIDSRKELERLLFIFTCSIFLSFFGAISDIRILINRPSHRIDSFFGIMRYSHMLATGSTFVLGMILYSKEKLKAFFYIFTYIISVFLVLFTKTRGAILAMIIAQVMLIIYFIILEKKYKVIIPIIVLLASAWYLLPEDINNNLLARFGNSTNSDNMRVIFWKASIDGFKESPLIGTGYRGAELAFKEYFEKEELTNYVMRSYGKIDGNSHNSYFESLLRFGILVGGYILIYLLVIIPVIWIKRYKGIEDKWKDIYKWIPFTFFGFYISMLTESVLSSRTGNLLILSISLMAMCIMNFSEDLRLEVEGE